MLIPAISLVVGILIGALLIGLSRRWTRVEVLPSPQPKAKRGIGVADLPDKVIRDWAASLGMPVDVLQRLRVVNGDYLESEHGTLVAVWSYDAHRWVFVRDPAEQVA